MSVQATLKKIGLETYCERFIDHGFDNWDLLIGISETDMASLGLKLGHIRKLQREVATCLGHPLRESLDLFSLSLTRRQYNGESCTPPWVVANMDEWGWASQYAHEQSSSDAGLMAYAYFLCQDSKISDMLYSKFPHTVRKKWSRLSVDGKDIWNIQVAEQLNRINSFQCGWFYIENWLAQTDYRREEFQLQRESISGADNLFYLSPPGDQSLGYKSPDTSPCISTTLLPASLGADM